MMHNSPFSASGMATSTSSHQMHSPNHNAWSTSSTGSMQSAFGDPLAQSRSHYQSGYLMSSSQNNLAPQGSQRIDEVPIVPTKAKMNQILSRGSATDFGMDSMFQSSRQRTLADEDAPPMGSINDIPNEINLESSPTSFQTKTPGNQSSLFSSRRQVAPATPSTIIQPNQLYCVIVFGYPPDKYSVTGEYFRSLGDSEMLECPDGISNCFKIGYRDSGDALRAVRKNGEVLEGTYIIGAKQDPSQGDLGQSLQRSLLQPSVSQSLSQNPLDFSASMIVDETSPQPHQSSKSSRTVGTPIKLAPSMSAFRKTPTVATSKPSTPQNAGWSNGIMSTSISAPPVPLPSRTGVPVVAQPSPSKTVIGQMSDLIFGW